MGSKRLSKLLISLIFLIFVINFLANQFYWYYTIWYFDMIMHFLGGFWIGLLILYFFQPKIPFRLLILTALLLVLFIGIGWEIFEALTDKVISQNPFNALDTFSDIFFDLSGGSFAILYFFREIILSEENRVKLK